MILENPKAGSHLVPLTACLVATHGLAPLPVLEVGMGDWSTPFLHRYCVASGRGLVSVDDVVEWVEAYDDHTGGDRRLVDYDVALPRLASQKWSVVLIDNWPCSRRVTDAMLFQDQAEFILVHDHAKAQPYFIQAGIKVGHGRVECDTLILHRKLR